MNVKNLDITIRRGATYQLPIMWEGPRLIYKPIETIANSAPVRITVPEHGLPDGWMVAVANARGLIELNAAGNPPRDNEFRAAVVLDASTIELNKVNAAGYKTHTRSTGQLVYYEPALPVTSAKARMQVKSKIGGEELYLLTTENGRIVLDPVRMRIVLIFAADAFVSAPWRTAVYDLEVEDASGVVTPIIYGAFALTDEVTTTL